MNPKLQRIYNEIERTRAKIAELQGTLPGLEEQRTELENIEFIKLIRSANVPPDALSAFVADYRAGLTKTARQGGGQFAEQTPEPVLEKKEEDSSHETV